MGRDPGAFCCECERHSALIYGINRIPGHGGATWAAFGGATCAGRWPGAGQRAGCRAGQRAGQRAGCRAGQRAGCSACAPGRQEAGIKKPRGISPGATRSAMGRFRSGPRLRPDHLGPPAGRLRRRLRPRGPRSRPRSRRRRSGWLRSPLLRTYPARAIRSHTK